MKCSVDDKKLVYKLMACVLIELNYIEVISSLFILK